MTDNKEIIPAIIAKNQQELDQRLNKVLDLVNIIQLDIMDNNFVPNLSLFFDFKLPKTSCIFEAHLMIEKPEEWIEKYAHKVDTILVHYESCNNLENIIDIVKKKHKKIGFVLNPETSIEKISNVLSQIDQVLIMTVKPGFYGSSFLPETLQKIMKLRELNPDLDLEVDGGITPDTISQANEAGANLFVSGSYIVKSDDPSKSIKNLKNLIK